MADLPGLTINDYLIITDSFEANPPLELSDNLDVIDIFSFDIERTLIDIQTPVSSFRLNKESGIILSDIQTLQNGYISATVFTPPDETVVLPPGTTINPPTGPFNVGNNRYLQKRVSFGGGGTSITLNAPDFGNTISFNPKEINEDTRGLVLIQFHYFAWPEESMHELTFSQLSPNEADSIRVFLRLTTGRIITYTDIYDVQHTVFITNPDAIITSSANGYSVKLSLLEGVPA